VGTRSIAFDSRRRCCHKSTSRCRAGRWWPLLRRPQQSKIRPGPSRSIR